MLVDENAVVAQRLVAGAVEFAGEETFRRTVRVRRVDDDQIVLALLATHETKAFLKPHLHAFVLQLGGRKRQVLLRKHHHILIDFHEVDSFNGTILGEFTHRAAVSSPDDEDVPDVRMHGHRHVGEHLVVDELVLFGDEEFAVKDEDASVGGRVEDVDLLD